MIELEKTYLLKEIPEGLKDCNFKEIIDIYIPKTDEHPKLRIRKNGDRYEITKKQPLAEDPSEMEEQTIFLSKEEFDALRQLEGKRVRKLRYYYEYNGRVAEVDVFQDNLKGLIVVDFEFDSIEEKNTFEMPEFCRTDITNEVFVAGGMLCGKSYSDIEKDLDRLGYKKIIL